MKGPAVRIFGGFGGNGLFTVDRGMGRTNPRGWAEKEKGLRVLLLSL
jgi:hypothetical protein